jgi:hypothetical protein
MAGALTAAIAAAFSGGGSPPVTTDPYFEYTTLLLPGNGTNGATNNTFLDGSTNNFTITRNGNTTQGTFSPFSQTGWGNYFSGTSGQYLNTVANAAFNFGTSDFTVEAWVYPGAAIALPMPIVEIRTSASNATGFAFFRYPSAQYLSVFSQGAVIGNSTNNLTQNTWNHVALVRSGNTWTFYINGVSSGSFTWASAQSDGATTGPKIGGSTSAGEVWVGYLSNVRIVKGVAVYTGNFTPPTSPLTATQSAGTNISAITGTQTSLLTCQSNRFVDNSVANSGTGFAITVNGSPSVQAFSPFNPTASWSAATNGGSGYFDGNGDYLSLPSSSVYNFSGDFTIEAWIYLTSLSQVATIIDTRNGDVLGAYDFAVTASQKLDFLFASSGTTRITSTNNVSLNTWTHVVVSRASGTLRLFINGNQEASTSTLAAINALSFPSIGGGRAGGTNVVNGYYLNGYISGLRVLNGTGYSTITVPAAPVTNITNTSLLLNFTNAGIYDATSKNDLETVGNAQISTAISAKWGSGSMYFDGNGDYLQTPSNPILPFGTGDFTIEFWAYWAGGSFTSYATAIDTRNGSVAAGLAIAANITTGAWYVSISAQEILGTVAAAASWQHIAVTRSGTSLRLFVNGTQTGSTYTSSNDFSNTTLRVGLRPDNQYPWNGYLQDLRITKGYARYTSNFTAPTAAFPTL